MDAFDVPAGEFDLEFSSTDTEVGAELDSPVVAEISSDSDSGVEILDAKIQPKVPNACQELQMMQDEERYGFLYRVQDRQAHIEDKLRRFKEKAAETPAQRQARRKSFQKAVLNHDV